jgi:sugar phosphate isomerase/epimerase
MILLGGPVAGLIAPESDPEALARAHVERGYGAAYFPTGDLPDEDYVRAVRDAFDQAGVVIAEVGAWCNLHAADPDERKRNLDYVCGRLAVADAVGARCCVDYIGTFAPGAQFAPHPKNLTQEGFDRTVETVRAVIDTVKPTRTAFALETMQTLLPDSPEAYRDLVDAVDRDAFGVHFDVANLVTAPRLYHDTPGLIRRSLELLGPRIVSCHAKDLELREELALHIYEVRPGLGAMDYAALLRGLAGLGRDLPLMLEHLETAEDYDAAAGHIRGVAVAEGVDITRPPAG